MRPSFDDVVDSEKDLEMARLVARKFRSVSIHLKIPDDVLKGTQQEKQRSLKSLIKPGLVGMSMKELETVDSHFAARAA